MPALKAPTTQKKKRKQKEREKRGVPRAETPTTQGRKEIRKNIYRIYR